MTVSIWIVDAFFGKLAPPKIGELYKCVTDEINTTFAIESTPEVIAKYNAKTTGGKYILNPNKG